MGEDATGGDRRRLTVPEAATVLGVTVDAVRGRIRRGTLPSEHDEHGKVYVWVESPEADSLGPSETVERPSSDQAALVEALREQVAYLQGVISTRDRELALRAEEIRRRDNALEREQELTAMFADRLRQLEAPQEPPGGPETASEGTERVEDPDRGTGSREATERRSWWRRVFGG